MQALMQQRSIWESKLSEEHGVDIKNWMIDVKSGMVTPPDKVKE